MRGHTDRRTIVIFVEGDYRGYVNLPMSQVHVWIDGWRWANRIGVEMGRPYQATAVVWPEERSALEEALPYGTASAEAIQRMKSDLEKAGLL